VSIRAIAYDYGTLENLTAHKEEALARFWQELKDLEAQRLTGFNTLICRHCGERLRVVRAFVDGNLYVDKCKRCKNLNVFRFEDIFWLDRFSLEDDERDTELRILWKAVVVIVATKLPEFCPHCGRRLDWFLMYEEEHHFAALCKCGKGFSKYSY
jgi:phage FluMu protein Com